MYWIQLCVSVSVSVSVSVPLFVQFIQFVVNVDFGCFALCFRSVSLHLIHAYPSTAVCPGYCDSSTRVFFCILDLLLCFILCINSVLFYHTSVITITWNCLFHSISAFNYDSQARRR